MGAETSSGSMRGEGEIAGGGEGERAGDGAGAPMTTRSRKMSMFMPAKGRSCETSCHRMIPSE